MATMRLSQGLLAVAVATATADAAALNIALGNEDGWDATGIQVLQQVLIDRGHAVTLAAPAAPRLLAGTALDTDPLAIMRVADNAFAVALEGDAPEPEPVAATPATSALIALDLAAQRAGAAPDLLLMGINERALTGSSALVSGAVGGALVALSRGFGGPVPAIVVSGAAPACAETATDEECAAATDAHYGEVASFVADFLDRIEAREGFLHSVKDGLLPRSWGLSINYPALPAAEVRGVAIAEHGRNPAQPGDLVFSCATCAALLDGETAPAGATAVSGSNGPDSREGEGKLLAKGYITVAPIQPNLTPVGYKRFKSVLNAMRADTRGD